MLAQPETSAHGRLCVRSEATANHFVVEFMGGIGNVLFQAAAAAGLASRTGTRVLVSNQSRRERDRLAGYIGSVPPLADRRSEYGTLGWIDGDASFVELSARAARRLDALVPGRRDWVSNPFMARPDHERWLPPFRRLRGYFQHPSWFEGSLPALTDAVLHHTVASARPRRPYVAVHLRRGDYVSLGWALPLSYYVRALPATRAAEGVPIVVLGDDPLAVAGLGQVVSEAGYVVVDRAEVVDPPPAPGAQGDFVVLACAADLVMSNGTFAWWSAVVGDRRSTDGARKVVYPSGWLSGKDPDVLRREAWTAVVGR